MLEAAAPMHYMMDQVGHEDPKTTLEIYATVQKRVSRPQVKRAFDLNGYVGIVYFAATALSLYLG